VPQIAAVKQIVPDYERGRSAIEKFIGQEKRLGQTFGAGLKSEEFP